MELALVWLIVGLAMAFLLRGVVRRLAASGVASGASGPAAGTPAGSGPPDAGCGCSSSDCPLVSRCHEQGSATGPDPARCPPAVLAATLVTAAGLALAPTAGASDLDIPEPTPIGSALPDHPSELEQLELEAGGTRSGAGARERLLGDLGGLRPWLAGHGLALEVVAIDEVWSSDRSVQTRRGGDAYHGLTDVTLSLDSDAAGLWEGGTLATTLQQIRGEALSEGTVGDVQVVSNIEGPEGARLVEYYLEQRLLDGALRIKVGKQDANADLVVTDGGAELINSSFGIIPNVPLPTFPAPALGILVGWSPSESFELKAGLWDGASGVGSGSFQTAFDGAGGTVGAIELELHRGPAGRATTCRLGAWGHSEVDVADPAGAVAAATRAGTTRALPTSSAAGAYLTLDHRLWAGAGRTVETFVQGGWARADRSAVSRFAGAGLLVRCPFTGPAGAGELIGLGLAHAELGDLAGPVPGNTSETVLELTYRRHLRPWLAIQPDLQLIHRPGGADHDTLVLGLRVQTTF